MRLNIEQSLNMYHCQNILFSLEVQVVQSRETLRSLEAHADQTRATLLILEVQSYSNTLPCSRC